MPPIKGPAQPAPPINAPDSGGDEGGREAPGRSSGGSASSGAGISNAELALLQLSAQQNPIQMVAELRKISEAYSKKQTEKNALHAQTESNQVAKEKGKKALKKGAQQVRRGNSEINNSENVFAQIIETFSHDPDALNTLLGRLGNSRTGLPGSRSQNPSGTQRATLPSGTTPGRSGVGATTGAPTSGRAPGKTPGKPGPVTAGMAAMTGGAAIGAVSPQGKGAAAISGPAAAAGNTGKAAKGAATGGRGVSGKAVVSPTGKAAGGKAMGGKPIAKNGKVAAGGSTAKAGLTAAPSKGLVSGKGNVGTPLGATGVAPGLTPNANVAGNPGSLAAGPSADLVAKAGAAFVGSVPVKEGVRPGVKPTALPPPITKPKDNSKTPVAAGPQRGGKAKSKGGKVEAVEKIDARQRGKNVVFENGNQGDTVEKPKSNLGDLGHLSQPFGKQTAEEKNLVKGETLAFSEEGEEILGSESGADLAEAGGEGHDVVEAVDPDGQQSGGRDQSGDDGQNFTAGEEGLLADAKGEEGIAGPQGLSDAVEEFGFDHVPTDQLLSRIGSQIPQEGVEAEAFVEQVGKGLNEIGTDKAAANPLAFTEGLESFQVNPHAQPKAGAPRTKKAKAALSNDFNEMMVDFENSLAGFMNELVAANQSAINDLTVALTSNQGGNGKGPDNPVARRPVSQHKNNQLYEGRRNGIMPQVAQMGRVEDGNDQLAVAFSNDNSSQVSRRDPTVVNRDPAEKNEKVEGYYKTDDWLLG